MVVSEGTLIVSGNLTASGTVVEVTGTFRYAGSTALERDITLNNGTFQYDSAAAFHGDLIFNADTVAGIGNMSNTVLTVDAGKTIAPGGVDAGTEALRTDSLSWSDAGICLWSISQLVGSAESAAGWDLLDIIGGLDILSRAKPSSLILNSGEAPTGWNAMSDVFMDDCNHHHWNFRF